jgi:hypothetical protein
MPSFEMPVIPSQSESYQKLVIEKIRSLEASVPKDRELQIHCVHGHDEIRVSRLQFTDGAIIIVHGLDKENNPTYLVSTSFVLEMSCKMVKKGPQETKTTIGFDFPPKTA